MKAEQKKSKMNKKADIKDVLLYWIIGLVALAVIILAIMILKDKSVSAIDYIKNLFKFGK